MLVLKNYQPHNQQVSFRKKNNFPKNGQNFKSWTFSEACAGNFHITDFFFQLNLLNSNLTGKFLTDYVSSIYWSQTAGGWKLSCKKISDRLPVSTLCINIKNRFPMYKGYRFQMDGFEKNIGFQKNFGARFRIYKKHKEKARLNT